MATIAIYEEDELMRALLSEWLSEAGYGIRARAPLDAERTSATNLVIASIQMPKSPG
jgi:DNA-binding response OmpR family regulator